MYILGVTLESMNEVLTQFYKLAQLGVSAGDAPVCVVSVDDLRICADLFNDEIAFVHYLTQRVLIAQVETLEVLDETDYLALYSVDSASGRNVAKISQVADADLVVGAMAGLEVDQHFKSVSYGGKLPDFAMPEIGGLVGRMWRWLRSVSSENCALQWFILELGAPAQLDLGEALEAEWARRRMEGGVKSISMDGAYGGVTAFCWGDGTAGRDRSFAIGRTSESMMVRGDEKRFMLELMMREDGNVEWVEGEWIEMPKDPGHVAALLEQAEILRKRRLERKIESNRALRLAGERAGDRRIGRNERCPCGSGKKFKRCCLGRFDL